MSEELLIEQLDGVIDAIIAQREASESLSVDSELAELASLAGELRLLPSQNFMLRLKETLIRSAMTTTTTASGIEPSANDAATRYHTVTPYLTVRGAEQLVEFVKDVFGGVEVFRATGSAGGLHAEVIVGNSKLLIGGYENVEEIPTALHLYVPNADEVYERALAAGATSLEQPVDQFYGDREAGVKDPTGNVWWIATRKGAAFIPEGLRSVTPFLHPIGAPGLVDFMKQAFGAEEVSREQSPEGMIHHAMVRIGDSMIEMGEAHGELAQPMPPALYMYVENLADTYERALAAGASSLQPPSDQSYGTEPPG